MIASVSWGRIVELWDAAGSGKPLQTLKGHSGEANGMAFSQGGKMLASRSWSDRKIKLWDTESGKLLQAVKLVNYSAWTRIILSEPFSVGPSRWREIILAALRVSTG
jgi:WD40 repeat protein